MKKILLISVLLNIVILIGLAVFIYKKGGINYLKNKLGNKKDFYPEAYYKRLNLLDGLPVVDSAIVFLGNSIIEQCECAELFKDEKVLNRGISHDNIQGVINRGKSIIKLKPVKLFILIGTNDLINGLNAEKFKREYEDMVKLFKQSLPETKIYLLSILPSDDIKRKNINIISANEIIKRLANKYSIQYIDLYSKFLKDGKLAPLYTDDGLHLNGEGYDKFSNYVESYF